MMDVSETLKAPRVEKKLPGVLSPEEVERLMDAVQGTSPKELRDKAMLELLYATGIRVSELIGLKLSDVNLKLSFLFCMEQNRQRTVLFGNKAKAALEAYLQHGRQALVAEETQQALFVNCAGKPMSRQGFWKLLKGLCAARGNHGRGHAAYSAPLLCGTSGCKRHKPAERAGNARTCRHLHDADLYQCESGTNPGRKKAHPLG